MSTENTFRAGIAALFRGGRFLLAHRSLLPFALWPLIIQLGCLTGLLIYFFDHTAAIVQGLTGWLSHPAAVTTTLWGKMFSGLLWMIHRIVYVLVIIIGLLISLLLTYIFGAVIAGPFNDLLSERTEILASGREPPPFSWRRVWKGTLRTMQVELQKALLFLGLPLVMLILHVIPVIGSILYIALTTAFGTWATGFTFVDYPMSRRLLPFRQRLRFARQHAYPIMGFGIIFYIPGALIFLSAPLIVGGTLLYLDLEVE